MLKMLLEPEFPLSWMAWVCERPPFGFSRDFDLLLDPWIFASISSSCPLSKKLGDMFFTKVGRHLFSKSTWPSYPLKFNPHEYKSPYVVRPKECSAPQDTWRNSFMDWLIWIPFFIWELFEFSLSTNSEIFRIWEICCYCYPWIDCVWAICC